jgi:hypothetical protein
MEMNVFSSACPMKNGFYCLMQGSRRRLHAMVHFELSLGLRKHICVGRFQSRFTRDLVKSVECVRVVLFHLLGAKSKSTREILRNTTTGGLKKFKFDFPKAKKNRDFCFVQ